MKAAIVPPPSALARSCARLARRRDPARLGLARLARPGAHRRLDRDGPARRSGRRPARTSRGRCRTADDPARWSSAIICICRTRPRPARPSRSGSCASTPTPASCCGSTATTCSPATCRRIASPGPRRSSIRATGNVFAISANGLVMSLSKRRQAAVGTIARRRDGDVDDAWRADVDADRRRQSADRERAHVRLGTIRRRRASFHLASTQRPARFSGSARPKDVRPTRFTPIPTSPT